MTRTFLVALELDPSESLEATSADIQESLETDGMTVTSVAPWASPLSSSTELDSLSLPTLGA